MPMKLAVTGAHEFVPQRPPPPAAAVNGVLNDVSYTGMSRGRLHAISFPAVTHPRSSKDVR
jgi:hypothetical protein